MTDDAADGVHELVAVVDFYHFVEPVDRQGTRPGWELEAQIATVSKHRLASRLGVLSDSDMRLVDGAIRTQFGLAGVP